VAHLRSLEEETSAYQSAQLPKGLLESTASEEALPSRSETGGGKRSVCYREQIIVASNGRDEVTGREVWGGAQLCHIGQLRWWDARLGGCDGCQFGGPKASYTAPCGAKAERPKLV
jgi:hypothetical protein